MSGVVLIGMMGAGKTTVGRELGARLGVPVYDTDRLLVQRLGRPVPQLFTLYGEDAFRDHESRILASLPSEPCVVATGGGIVLRPQNWVEMRRLGTVVFLDVAEDVLRHRLTVTTKRRPLLDQEDWEERFARILSGRRDLYEQADLRIPVAFEDASDVAGRIQEALPT